MKPHRNHMATSNARGSNRALRTALLILVIASQACGSQDGRDLTNDVEPSRAVSSGLTLSPPFASGTCSATDPDVTDAFNNWLTSSVPDGTVNPDGTINYTTISLPAGSCYRIDGTILFNQRHNIIIDGNGSAALKAVVDVDPNATSHLRARLEFNRGSNFLVRNLTLRGSNFTTNCAPPHGPSCMPSTPWDHNILVLGTDGVVIDHLNLMNTWGDAVDIQPGGDSWNSDGVGAILPSNITINNCAIDTSGRNGVSATAGSNIVITNNSFFNLGLAVIDLEPEAATWDITNVTIDSNTFGQNWAQFVVSAGAVNAKHGPYTIKNNTQTTDRAYNCIDSIYIADGAQGPVNVVGPITITNNKIRSIGNGILVNSFALSKTIVRANAIDHFPIDSWPCTTNDGLVRNTGISVKQSATGQIKGSISGNTVRGFITATSAPGSATLACGNRTSDSAPYSTPTVCRPTPPGIDLNHDGWSDICGRSSNGLQCASGNGGSFAGASMWTTFPHFSDSWGWSAESYYASIGYPDVNGDGKSDVCARASLGIACGTSTGSQFTTDVYWTSGGAFSDASGWGAGAQYYSTIRYPDLNGDGNADVCGRGGTGILCALSSGTGFGTAANWTTDFNDASGWNGIQYYASIDYPDVNGDGRADVCGRGPGGIRCGISNGSTGFGTITAWTQASGVNYRPFTDNEYWSSNERYYSTIRYPDLDGDGRADVCGRWGSGIKCALSQGTQFGTATMWTSDFSDALGWDTSKYYSTIAYPDVNGDGKADICGRAPGGIVCALSTGSGFGPATAWTSGGAYPPAFGDASGWGAGPQYYSTINFADRNGDGMADVCGRNSQGIECALSTGTSFASATMWTTTAFSDASSWGSSPGYYSTIH